jgi:hypothetical protein
MCQQEYSVKVTGLAQKLGQLEAVNRDFQSKSWTNLNLLGHPCNFYAYGTALWELTRLGRKAVAQPEEVHVEVRPNLSEKVERLAQNMQVGPCIPVGTRL